MCYPDCRVVSAGRLGGKSHIVQHCLPLAAAYGWYVGLKPPPGSMRRSLSPESESSNLPVRYGAEALRLAEWAVGARSRLKSPRMASA